MSSKIRNQMQDKDRSTKDLLCLLASYDVYGTGSPWPRCLDRLAGTGGR